MTASMAVGAMQITSLASFRPNRALRLAKRSTHT
jgi:hypothetical protein